MDTPDNGVIALMKGLKSHESNGNYSQTPETAGTSLGGAYMYQKPTWQGYAKDTMGDPNLAFTPENQDKVTYYKIKQWKDQGLTPEQIISKWNPGAGQQYVDKVKKAILNGTAGQGQSGSSSSSSTKKSFDDIPDNTPSPSQPSSTDTTAPGTFLQNLGQGHFGDAIQSGIRDFGSALTFGGSEELGKGISSPVAKAGEKIKGLYGGQDNSKYIPAMTEQEKSMALGGGAKVAGAIGGLATLGATSGLLAERVLTSPAILERLPANMTKEVFLNLGKREQLNILGDLAQTATKTGAEGDLVDIAKAIKSLKPTASFIGKLFSNVKNVATYELLKAVLGDKIGGFIHKSL